MGWCIPVPVTCLPWCILHCYPCMTKFSSSWLFWWGLDCVDCVGVIVVLFEKEKTAVLVCCWSRGSLSNLLNPNEGADVYVLVLPQVCRLDDILFLPSPWIQVNCGQLRWALAVVYHTAVILVFQHIPTVFILLPLQVGQLMGCASYMMVRTWRTTEFWLTSASTEVASSTW